MTRRCPCSAAKPPRPPNPIPPRSAPPAGPGRRRLGLTLIVVPLTLIPFLATERVSQRWPAPVSGLYRWVQPFRTFNNYGLFAVMTPTRPEIIVQGSDDGRTWLDYEFKYKPGDVGRARPDLSRPINRAWIGRCGLPRWAARGTTRGFCASSFACCKTRPPSLALLARNPFPDAPPKYVRALLYEYHFTDRATRRATGQWWRRQLQGMYVPPLSLEDFHPGRGLSA